MLLIKVFRPEKLPFMIRKYIKDKLGDTYISHQQTSMQMMVDASDNVTPIIFVLSQGADPSQLLLKFAIEEHGQELQDNMISLGQG